MTNHFAAIAVGTALVLGAGAAHAQQVNKNDRSQPSAGEIALATDCRDTFTRMRVLEKQMDANRDERAALDIKVKKSEQILDELHGVFKQKSGQSAENDEAYNAALEAKKIYEEAAVAHNAIIDEQDKLSKKRSKLSDEFFVVNPNYVAKCSGTIFKALSIILTCKDEQSEWCDLLK